MAGPMTEVAVVVAHPDDETLWSGGLILQHLINLKLIKVLAHGDISKSLTVSAHKVSKSAQAKIEAAGGKVEILKSR